MLRFQYAIPSSSVLYVNEYINLIEFKVLNPQTLIRFWKPDFDIKVLIVGAKAQMEYSKDERESIFDEMFIFAFIGGVVLIGLLLAFISSKLMTGTSLSDRIKEEINKKKKAFFFNGAIRSYSVAYIKLGIASSIQIMMQVSGSPYVKASERVNSICIFLFLSSSIVGFYTLIWWNQEKIIGGD